MALALTGKRLLLAKNATTTTKMVNIFLALATAMVTSTTD